ncbi:MAG TPA: hypothetical protein DEG90_00060 [Porphyromonadaceae bacterium]|nr:hypothetical protein [Porphyromonadaceae bacterium]
MNRPYIISFANSKGGVGKTTLCMAFANFLVAKEMNVQIVDCDDQRSIQKKRESELEIARDNESPLKIPYKIFGYRFSNAEKTQDLLKVLCNNNIFSLLDMPGSENQKGMEELIISSDIIVIPFIYEFMVLGATAEFVMNIISYIKEHKKKVRCRLVFVPNCFNPSTGTKEEKEKFDSITASLSKFGVVTAPIHIRQDMKRFSTISDLDRQNEIVNASFEEILKIIESNHEEEEQQGKEQG